MSAKNNPVNPIAAGLQGIGLVLLFVLTLLGLYYLQGIIIAGALSLLCAVFLFVIVTLLVKSKNRKINRGIRPLEIGLLIAYLGLAVVTFWPISHFVNIELLLKDDIQEDASDRLDLFDEMTLEYKEKVRRTSDLIQEQATGIIENYRIGGMEDRVFIDSLVRFGIAPPSGKREDMIRGAEDRLEIKVDQYANNAERGLADFEKANDKFVRTSRLFIDGWDRAQLEATLQNTDRKLDEQALFLRDNFRYEGKGDDIWNDYSFNYSVPAGEKMENLLSDRSALITRYSEEYQPWLALAFTVVIYLFILSPYLLLDRAGNRVIYNDPSTAGDRGIPV